MADRCEFYCDICKFGMNVKSKQKHLCSAKHRKNTQSYSVPSNQYQPNYNQVSQSLGQTRYNQSNFVPPQHSYNTQSLGQSTSNHDNQAEYIQPIYNYQSNFVPPQHLYNMQSLGRSTHSYNNNQPDYTHSYNNQINNQPL